MSEFEDDLRLTSTKVLMALDITVLKRKEEIIASISGKIDISSYDIFIKKLHELLLSGRPTVILDLSGVVFISSMGISAILEARNYAANHNGKFILVGLSERVYKIFDLIGALEYLNIYKSVDEAIEVVTLKTSA